MLLSLFVLACAKERPPAPADLDRLIREAYRDYDVPDLVAPHADAIGAWLARSGGEEVAWEGMRIGNLSEGELSGVVVPDGTDLTAHRGVATAYQSLHDIDAHAGLAVAADQTWADPATFERYERRVIEGDREAFAAGEGAIRTENTIEKSGAFGILIPYTLRKDFRWVEGEEGRSLLARWWLLSPGCSDNGKNCVLQSFGLEIWVDRPLGAHRLLTNWIEVVTEADALLSEDARIGLIATGNQDLLLATDEHLSAGGGR